MTKKILCRADGNSEIGLGHLYRMLAITEFYKKDYELIFLTNESSTTSIIPKEIHLKFIPENISILEEPHWISTNFSHTNHIIIADGYQFISSYQKELKKHGFTLIYIDDLAKEYDQLSAIAVGLGINSTGKHLYSTKLFAKTLQIRNCYVDPHISTNKIFPWIKEQKEQLNLSGKKIHLITGQDDLVVGAGGMKNLIEKLKNKNNITFDEPAKLAHHLPEQAAKLISRFITD